MIKLDTGMIQDFLADLDINVQIVAEEHSAQYENPEGHLVRTTLSEISANVPNEQNAEVRAVLTQLKAKLREARGTANTILAHSLSVGGDNIQGSRASIMCVFVTARVEVDPRTLRVRHLISKEEPGHIGDVAHALTLGYRCTRPTWANDAFVYLQNASEFQVNRAPLLGIFPEDTNIKFAAHIDQYQDDGSCRIWTPTVEDLLATDWLVLAHEAGA